MNPPDPHPTPTITVGIPTFNRRESLQRALASVAAQEGPFLLDLVVSDNASEDGTMRALGEAAKADPRIRVLQQRENRGPVENFRTVLAASRGDFFAWLADDDWLDPGYLAACLERLQADPGLALVAGRARFHPGSHAKEGRETELGAPCNLLSQDPARRITEHFRTVRHNSVLFGVMRSEDAQRLHVPDGVAADWLVVGQLAAVGRVETLSGVFVNRSTGGVSASMETVTAYFGLKGRRARNPWGVVSRRVGRSIASGQGLFRVIPSRRRVPLAWKTAWILLRIHYLSHVRRRLVYALLASTPVQWVWRKVRPLLRGA